MDLNNQLVTGAENVKLAKVRELLLSHGANYKANDNNSLKWSDS